MKLLMILGLAYTNGLDSAVAGFQTETSTAIVMSGGKPTPITTTRQVWVDDYDQDGNLIHEDSLNNPGGYDTQNPAANEYLEDYVENMNQQRTNEEIDAENSRIAECEYLQLISQAWGLTSFDQNRAYELGCGF